MLQIQMRILRVFGLSKAEMNSIIENAQAEGSPSLRLQERDGEYLVCVQASAPTQAMADEYCEKWVQKLRTRFGDACYGFEDTTLAQAALDALLKKRRLLVAADEATGRLLGNALRGLQHSEAAFDFGNQTYLNPANARRIAAPEALLKKFPGDMVQAAAGRAQSALLRRDSENPGTRRALRRRPPTKPPAQTPQSAAGWSCGDWGQISIHYPTWNTASPSPYQSCVI